MYDPLAGVVISMFGSDSHVTCPLNLRMYLYWICVLAGRLIVTVEKNAKCECDTSAQ